MARRDNRSSDGNPSGFRIGGDSMPLYCQGQAKTTSVLYCVKAKVMGGFNDRWEPGCTGIVIPQSNKCKLSSNPCCALAASRRCMMGRAVCDNPMETHELLNHSCPFIQATPIHAFIRFVVSSVWTLAPGDCASALRYTSTVRLIMVSRLNFCAMYAVPALDKRSRSSSSVSI